MYCTGTYELITSTQISTKPGAVVSIEVLTDGSNDATGILYDVDAVGDIAATNKLQEIVVKSGMIFGGRTWEIPRRFGVGLYLALSGTGASAIVEYLK